MRRPETTMHPHPPDPHDEDALAWQAQRDALRGLHRTVLDEPVPQALLDTLEHASAHGAARRRWLQGVALAASVLAAFAVGWLANGQWTQRAGMQLARNGTPALRAFSHDAAVAHAVYSPEKRHPVEVAASEQQHLVQWLSRRLDRPLKLPDLAPLGYTLVGGRLLPGGQGARAQFMFEDAQGQRVTLYIGALQASDGTAANETSFRFAPDDPVPSFYWADRGFGYALAGKLPRETLLALATAVHRQI
jgi:anti-sigma factor RsiW